MRERPRVGELWQYVGLHTSGGRPSENIEENLYEIVKVEGVNITLRRPLDGFVSDNYPMENFDQGCFEYVAESIHSSWVGRPAPPEPEPTEEVIEI